MKARRTELGLSAQAVADKTSELGYPLGRGTIARMETGARGGKFDVSELFILACALQVSPIQLLWHNAPDAPVELLPGYEEYAGFGYEWTVGDRVLNYPEPSDELDKQYLRLQALRRLMDARRALVRLSQARHPSRSGQPREDTDVAALHNARHVAEDEAAAHGWQVRRG